MDSRKFGEFIAMIRKEKGWTQTELAEKLNVTDKAVSRWERGLGFPDINTVKPLADALEVSVLEIMQSEKEPEDEIPADKAGECDQPGSSSTPDGAKEYCDQCSIRRVRCIIDIFDGSHAVGSVYFCVYAIYIFGDRDRAYHTQRTQAQNEA